MITGADEVRCAGEWGFPKGLGAAKMAHRTNQRPARGTTNMQVLPDRITQFAAVAKTVFAQPR
jgi:hypothetical protein